MTICFWTKRAALSNITPEEYGMNIGINAQNRPIPYKFYNTPDKNHVFIGSIAFGTLLSDIPGEVLIVCGHVDQAVA